MKTLYLFIFAIFSIDLMADEIPFVVINDAQTSQEVLNLDLKDPVKLTLTAPGKAIKPVQDLSYSCFKDGMDVTNPSTNTTMLDDLIKKLKEKYSFIDETVIRDNYKKWKNIKDTKNYVDSESYDNQNTNYFEDKVKDRSLWRWAKLYCGKDTKNTKETLEQRLNRCNSMDFIYGYLNLGCNASYTCYLPGETPKQEYEPVERECPTSTATFKSDRLDMVDPGAVGTCLNTIPSNAVNIKVFFSVCSTVVKRVDTDTETKRRIKELTGVEDNGTNLTLTAARLKELESIIKTGIVTLGFNEKNYVLIPADESDHENYYYDPKANATYRSGTCGPLTNSDLFHETWVPNYKSATQNYLTANRLDFITAPDGKKIKNPNYAWILEDPVSVNPKSPDALMSPGRFNTIKVTYDVPKETPKTTSEISFGNPQVFCVGINAQPENAKPNKKARGGLKKPFLGGKKKTNKRSTTCKPKGPDASCPTGFSEFGKD